jgi:quercetin dioxygenase-like cupin family protein
MTAGSSTYPRTIENGVGDQVTLLGVDADGDGREILQMESRVGAGNGPPIHVHHLQEESLTVKEGRLAYQVAGEPARFAAPGDTVSFRAGQTHRFWNAGDGDLVCSGWVSPPYNLEYFLTELYESARRAGGSRPDVLDAAYLVGRYHTEFGIADVPAPVQRLMFPVLRIAGRLLGGQRRFADSPAPIRR